MSHSESATKGDRPSASEQVFSQPIGVQTALQTGSTDMPTSEDMAVILASAKEARYTAPKGFTYEMFQAADGVRLRYGYAPAFLGGAARGTVIFLPGRTEFTEKFYEDMHIMQALGFAVAGLDLRGQGLSERPYGNDNKHELDSFDPHITDVANMLDKLEGAGYPKPYVLMAHSAGSHVSLRAMHDLGTRINRAILSAPMVRIKPAVMSPIMKGLAWFMTKLGYGGNYVPGHTAFREGPWGWRKQLTHDDDRFKDEDYFIKNIDAGLLLGGATYRWLLAAIRSTDVLNAAGYAEAINQPVLVFQADEDMIVDNGAMAKLVWRLPRGKLVVVPHAKHELYKETDAVRTQLYTHILPFIADL